MNPVKVPVQFFYFDFESKCKSTIVWFGLFYLLVLGLVYYVGEMRTCQRKKKKRIGRLMVVCKAVRYFMIWVFYVEMGLEKVKGSWS